MISERIDGIFNEAILEDVSHDLILDHVIFDSQCIIENLIEYLNSPDDLLWTHHGSLVASQTGHDYVINGVFPDLTEDDICVQVLNVLLHF